MRTAREKAARGNLRNVYKYLKILRYEEDRARLLSVVPSDKNGGNGHKLKQEIPSEHQEMLFDCEGDQALA